MKFGGFGSYSRRGRSSPVTLSRSATTLSAGSRQPAATAMCSNEAGNILRRVIPPPHLGEEKRPRSVWLLVPKAIHPAPAIPSSDPMAAEVEDPAVERHETPLGACLLSPKSTAVAGWGIRRKVQYTGRQHREMPMPMPMPMPPSSSDTKSEETTAEQQRVEKRRPPSERKKKKKSTKTPRKKPRRDSEEKKRRMGTGEGEQERQGAGSRVDRWSSERYEAAEMKLVEIMRVMGAVLGSPVARQAVREEARKHIGDTGLLDHLLKHMVGKVVADGSERLRRMHNAEGAMEYWLEPANLAEIRRNAGVSDPFWIPPPGWKLGDATALCPCGEDCEKEACQIRDEVAAVQRDYQSLLQWKSKVEEEMAGLSSCLQALKDEMQLMKEEKKKKSELAGAYHSSILHTV